MRRIYFVRGIDHDFHFAWTEQQLGDKVVKLRKDSACDCVSVGDTLRNHRNAVVRAAGIAVLVITAIVVLRLV